MATTEYPEHDRLAAIQHESQAIGEFLEMGGYTLCELRTFTEPLDDEPNGRTYETRPQFAPVTKSIQQILADWFQIDLNKIEAEKRAMLDAIRSAA
jgi:hypothetical protein